MDEKERNLKQKPVLRNKEALRDNVLHQIELDSRLKAGNKMIWIRIAASLLVLLSVVSYIWMEASTQYSRFDTLGAINERIVIVKPDWNCRNNIMALLEAFNSSGFKLYMDEGAMLLDEAEVKQLQHSNEELYLSALSFVEAIKKHYPRLYQQYKSGESVRLNLWLLKEDQRLCEYIKH